jgi:ABC-type antimicrobial peptide transport system permease subunit
MTKVISHFEYQDGRPYQNMVAPTVMAPIVAEEIAGIEGFTRFVRDGGSINYKDKTFSESVSFADSTFFDMFEFQLRSGATSNFKNKESIFLTLDLANKYFDDANPIGQIMTFELRNKKYEVIVGGVFEKIPQNTSFNMDALIRIETYLDVYEIGPNDWGEWRDASTVFEVANNTNLEILSVQLNKYLDLRNEFKTDENATAYKIVAFSEPIDEETANWTYIMPRLSLIPLLVFITLASMILLIACFNLTNTTIALTVKRLKEIGVRKVVGARRSQIITQFLLEMVITITLAVIVGMGLSQIIVPEFTAMWGLLYSLEDLSTANLLAALVILIFISALLAGAYPALNNSKFKPVSLLKGQSKVKGTNTLIRILLVAQFSLSIIVLVAGIIFTLNSRYQNDVSLGYDMDQVLIVSVQGPEQYQGLKNAIMAYPKIEEVAVTDHHIGYGSYSNPIKIDTAEFTTQVYEVGATYFDVLGLPIIKGRGFIEGSELDFEESVIIDEEFVELHNLESPLGTKILFQENWYHVVGVVASHLNDLWKSDRVREGHFYRVAKPEQYRRLVARVSAEEDMLATTEYIENQWKDVFPDKPFLSRTQEDVVYGNINETNENLTVIFFFLTILGCLLSASGIYSLANLNIEKRTKEIGVRKVLGASVTSIVQLINKEFVIILLAAMVFGGAGGYVLTNALLNEIYATHIDVGVFTIILCGMLIFFIGIGTTSSTILHAAHSNPVDTLKDE